MASKSSGASNAERKRKLQRAKHLKEYRAAKGLAPRVSSAFHFKLEPETSGLATELATTQEGSNPELLEVEHFIQPSFERENVTEIQEKDLLMPMLNNADGKQLSLERVGELPNPPALEFVENFSDLALSDLETGPQNEDNNPDQLADTPALENNNFMVKDSHSDGDTAFKKSKSSVYISHASSYQLKICSGCGGPRDHPRTRCSAFRLRCSNCLRWGHVPSVCRASQTTGFRNLRVRINGVTATALLDSAAGWSAVSRQFLNRLDKDSAISSNFPKTVYRNFWRKPGVQI